MTELSRDTVKRIAELARLSLSDDEVSLYQTELLRILQAFEKLSEVNLKVPHGEHASALQFSNAHAGSESSSHMRSDIADNSLETGTFITQSPDREGVFVRVPAVLDRST